MATYITCQGGGHDPEVVQRLVETLRRGLQEVVRAPVAAYRGDEPVRPMPASPSTAVALPDVEEA